jgi:hypothetical protein
MSSFQISMLTCKKNILAVNLYVTACIFCMSTTTSFCQQATYIYFSIQLIYVYKQLMYVNMQHMYPCLHLTYSCPHVSPQCQQDLNDVDMQHATSFYVNMQFIYVDIQLYHVNMQLIFRACQHMYLAC